MSDAVAGAAAVQLLTEAAQLLQAGVIKWEQGAYATGLLVKDKPQNPEKPWPAPHEIYPWLPKDKIHRIDSVSLMGALCYCATAASTPVIQAALAMCSVVLTQRGCAWLPEAWNDAPGRTVDEVIALLTAAAGAAIAPATVQQ